ncbi:MAG TPA: class I SAM-dependent methyltransferase [Polyangiales bacterium]|nr:class I SAM-dependent methyltransferase [Polyangiales bacterium]
MCDASPDRVEFISPCSPLDHCAACGHVYTRLTPRKLILQLMYGHLSYWNVDKEHQGIATMEQGPHWRGFVAARMNALRHAGLLEDGPKRIFEIGCAEGMLLHELSQLGHEALGSELNEPVARAGMQSLGVQIRTGMFEEIALPTGHYDAVISFHTIEHIIDLERTFRKIARILKPDGVLLIEVPTGPEEYTNRDHVHFFNEASLQRLLERYFEVGETLTNHYVSSAGASIGSLYGVGRRPLRPAC